MMGNNWKFNKLNMKNKLIINRQNNNSLINNKLAIIFLIIMMFSILLIVNIPQASALGISPGRTTINYEEGLQREIKFSVLNSEYKGMKVSLSVQGELKDYVKLSQDLVEFRTIDENKELTYTVNLPVSLKDKPGLHSAEIVALEDLKDEGEGTHIGATVAVLTQFYVYVPCPGKCIEADLEIVENGEGNPADLFIPVISRGKQKIDEIHAVIEIISVNGDKIDSIETNSASIDAGSRTELSGKWNSTKNGEYTAKIKVYYDGAVHEFSKTLNIGNSTVDIARVWVNNFNLGGIAKFNILVDNKWNKELKSVFANLVVFDKGHNSIADVKSSSEDIPALSTKELIAYWDTQGIEEGEYDGKLMIKYGQKSSDRSLVLRLSQNSLYIYGVGYAVSSYGDEGGLSVISILIILVAVLLIGNIAWFTIFRLRKKSKNKKKQVNTQAQYEKVNK